jgi:predicted methyltransferase
MRLLLAAASALVLAAGPIAAAAHDHSPRTRAAAHTAIAAALAPANRDAEDVARDDQRHPMETLHFWGVKPNMTIVELGAGGGYWTDILSQIVRRGGGKLIVTFNDPDMMNDQQKAARDAFLKKYQDKPEVYGTVAAGILGPRTTKPIAEAGSADMVLSSRNFHGWMRFETTDKYIADINAVLKPGGLVAVEQHRANANALQDPKAMNGYVRQDYVIAQFLKAGFQFVGSSEVNANPRDTKDHPFGVWTLPPNLRGSPVGTESRSRAATLLTDARADDLGAGVCG